MHTLLSVHVVLCRSNLIPIDLPNRVKEKGSERREDSLTKERETF